MDDVLKHPIVYKVPLTRPELQQFLSENVFTRGVAASKGKLGKKGREQFN
jgi:hypothetical protein